MNATAHRWLIVHRWLLVASFAIAAAAPLAAQEIRIDAPLPPAELEKLGRLRSEAEDDRVAATVHYLQARLALGREDKAAALRHYQRAWRWNPQQTALLQEIVPLAFELKRHEEAARYAILAAERDPNDALLLRRLARYLTEKRDWPRALRLYEEAERLDGRHRRPETKPDLGVATTQLEMGRLYFLAGNFARSAAAFAVVRDILDDPTTILSDDAKKLLIGNAAESYSLWAEAFLASGRLDEAETLFARSHASEPGAALLAFQLARCQAKRGDAHRALVKLDEYFAAKSTAAGVEPYDLLAELLAKQAADADAARKATLQRLEQLVQHDADNLPLKRALGGQYFAAGDFERAEPLLAAVVADQPNAGGYEKLADIYRRFGQPQKLLALLGEVAAEIGTLEALGDASRAAIAADKPLVQQLVELARSDQGEGKAFAAGLVALDAREFDAADELLLAAASLRPPAKEAVLLRWGLGMMLADRPARAAKVFQRIIDEQAIAGDQATPHYYLAAALALENRTDEALAASRRAAELKPDSAQFAAREGWILHHTDRDEAARSAYLQFLAKFDSRPGDSETRDAVREAKLALSNIDLARGDYSAAVEWLQQVLDEFPEDVGAGNDLGYLWADRGEHLQRALALIELAVKAEPENTAYRDSLGWVYFRLGRADDAVRELRKAAEGGDPDGVVLDHLGEALTKSGQPSEAQAAWKRAASAFQKAGDIENLEAVQKKLRAD